MKILIVDDDQAFIELLKEKLFPFFKMINDDVEIQICFQDFQNIDVTSVYDYIFLDIELIQTNGFVLAKEFQNHAPSTHIVFISAKNQFIHSSMLLQPFYFIRKSHLESDLKNFYMLAKKQMKVEHSIDLQYNYVKAHVKVSDILFIESKQHVLYVHCLKDVYQDNRSLKEMLNILKDDDFVQIHKSYIIHFSYLVTYSHQTVKLSQNQILDVGRRYKDQFEKSYKEYLLK